MMSLSNIVNNLTYNTKIDALDQLNRILNHAQVTVSFFGTRKICHNGEEYSIKLLTRKIISAANICFAQGLDELRREKWIHIAHKVSAFNGKTDNEAQKRNCITRFFLLCKEIGPDRDRASSVNDTLEQQFCCYSEFDFKILQGRVEGINVVGRCEPPVRLIVSQETIFFANIKMLF